MAVGNKISPLVVWNLTRKASERDGIAGRKPSSLFRPHVPPAFGRCVPSGAIAGAWHSLVRDCYTGWLLMLRAKYSHAECWNSIVSA